MISWSPAGDIFRGVSRIVKNTIVAYVQRRTLVTLIIGVTRRSACHNTSVIEKGIRETRSLRASADAASLHIGIQIAGVMHVMAAMITFQAASCIHEYIALGSRLYKKGHRKISTTKINNL